MNKNLYITNEIKESRRNFLWKIGKWISLMLMNSLISCENNEYNKEKITKRKDINLMKKPIDLYYINTIEDEKVILNLPGNMYKDICRVVKCLRRKPITDAVENRYDIPKGLLLGMMAQEWCWDPTLPNSGWDWWLWLIHIQAINAKNFGLKTLQTHTKKMKDLKHGKIINNIKKHKNNDIKLLIKEDERFHPILSIDVAARFLIDKKPHNNWIDNWIIALKRYSWRQKLDEYVYPVLKYRCYINNIMWKEVEWNFSSNILNQIKKNQKSNILNMLKNEIKEFTAKIGWEEVWIEEYLKYFEKRMENFELEKYQDLGIIR